MKYVKCFIGENVRERKGTNWRITHDKIYEVVRFSSETYKPNQFHIVCDDNSIGSFTISESCGPAEFTFMIATAEIRDNKINQILND